jgi:hypothetical protein
MNGNQRRKLCRIDCGSIKGFSNKWISLLPYWKCKRKLQIRLSIQSKAFKVSWC